MLEAPFAAWRIGLPVRWVLRRHFSDPIYWWCGGLTTLWAYLVVSLWPGASLLLLAALWAPPIVLQILASMNDEQRAEIERLRLERSVIRAVASGSDPVAQIAFTLRSFAGPESGETFAIYIHESEGGWRHVASVGSAPSPQAVDASGQMLRRLGADGSTALRMFDGFSVWAKAIEDGEGRDATAALVVTCTGSPNGNDIEHYVSAGHGIAPLVRELRLLTSIQDAASTEALTRLRNRKTVLRQLDALAPRRFRRRRDHDDRPDYFARINNKLGHLAGDRCLQSIAGAIKDAVRDDAHRAVRRRRIQSSCRQLAGRS